MGLIALSFVEILKLFNGKPMEKSICMMGKQKINIEWDKFYKIINQFGFDYDKDIFEEIYNIYPIDPYKFFQMFGFTDVHALDVSAYEGADIIFDLNESGDLPDYLFEKFDLVVDGGTLEHIFDIRNAITNMSRMVKKDGYIYHAVSCSGFVNHGFYSFSPSFFLDYYGVDFNVIDLSVRFYLKRIDFENGKNMIYSQDCRLFDNYWELNEHINRINSVSELGATLTVCVAQKKQNVKNICPTQGYYKERHGNYEKNKNDKKDKKPYQVITDYKKILELFRENNDRNIALYGAGNDCNLLLNQLYMNDMENLVKVIFDTDILRAGTRYRGYEVLYPTRQKLHSADIIFISSTKYADDIYNFLVEQEVVNSNIYKITDYLVNVT